MVCLNNKYYEEISEITRKYKGYCICIFAQYYLICKEKDIVKHNGKLWIEPQKCIHSDQHFTGIAFGVMEDCKTKIDELAGDHNG